jgi:excisionase family DNA binding protein
MPKVSAKADFGHFAFWAQMWRRNLMNESEYTVNEVAQKLGLSRATVWKMIWNRKIGFIRKGNGKGLVRVTESQLQAYRARATFEPVAA